MDVIPPTEMFSKFGEGRTKKARIAPAAKALVSGGT